MAVSVYIMKSWRLYRTKSTRFRDNEQKEMGKT